MTSTTTTNNSWIEARQAFRAAVTTAVEELVQRGFSRDRATAAVLRQITGGPLDKPSDDEIFAFVEKHGLGNQQALFALTLSTVLKNQFTRDISQMEQGLRAMTAVVQRVPEQPYMSDSKESTPVDLPLESSNISLPVKFSSDKIQSKLLNGERKGKAKAKLATTRKRVLETTGTSSEEEPVVDTKRLRANSVSEEVSAKVEEAAATRAVAPDAKVKASPAVARSKRSRSVEEGEGVVPKAVALATGKRRKSSL